MNIEKIKNFIKNIKKETWIRIIIYVSIVIFGFILDRITKNIASSKLILGELKQVEIIPNLIYFSYVTNKGGAWSILSNATWLLTIFSAVSVGAISYYMFKSKINIFYFVSCSMFIAGGLGNLYDRIVYGYVIDFIETYPFGYAFPIFNVADMFVVIAAIIMAVYMLFEEKKEKEKSRTKILTEEEITGVTKNENPIDDNQNLNSINDKDDNDGRNVN